jgi:hypothetical protein
MTATSLAWSEQIVPRACLPGGEIFGNSASPFDLRFFINPSHWLHSIHHEG